MSEIRDNGSELLLVRIEAYTAMEEDFEVGPYFMQVLFAPQGQYAPQGEALRKAHRDTCDVVFTGASPFLKLDSPFIISAMERLGVRRSSAQ